MNSRSERLAKLAPLLRRLKHSVGRKRRDNIRKCRNDLNFSLSECCHNVLKGNVSMTPAQKVKLRRHKHNLRKLSTKNASIKASKKFLQRGGFLSALITPILSVLGSLLMKHAKKMVLVDPRVLKQLKDKASFDHEKLLDKKRSRSAEMKVASASDLEIESILGDNTITDDQKMKMYSAH